jgi:hypothetical protein
VSVILHDRRAPRFGGCCPDMRSRAPESVPLLHWSTSEGIDSCWTKGGV